MLFIKFIPNKRLLRGNWDCDLTAGSPPLTVSCEEGGRCVGARAKGRLCPLTKRRGHFYLLSEEVSCLAGVRQPVKADVRVEAQTLGALR